MDNGCPQCAELEFGEICLDCQIEQADSDVCRAMNELERLQKQRTQLILTQNGRHIFTKEQIRKVVEYMVTGE